MAPRANEGHEASNSLPGQAADYSSHRPINRSTSMVL